MKARAPLLVAISVLVAAVAGARPLPRLDGRIVDEAGALPPESRAALDAKLTSYERATGHQFAVLILDSLGGDPLEELSLRAAEQWRLGDARRDDGLLLVVAMKERAARIEVGYGLEGTITDALSAGVIRDVMAPRFAAGDFAAGIDAGTTMLMRAAEGESTGLGPSGSAARAPPPALSLLGPLVMIALFVIVSVLGRRRGGGDGGLFAFILLSSLFRGGLGAGGGGGFSGGGGGFGGGGASGRW